MAKNYEQYMLRCIDLARNGKGRVAPNPMVGSIIVHNDTIIGEGFHEKFGGSHAEVNAINSVKDQSLLQESTLYVSLEPCSHSGKTPPCSDLLIEKKIKKVVIGSVDINSLVAGKGIEKLRRHGVDVVENVLENKCKELNKRFFTYHKYKRPFIILKWAQSRDGFIDVLRKAGSPIGPNWISNPISRMLVHKWRSNEQAILVGTNTVIFDNPGLDTRLWAGDSPLRMTIDKDLRIEKKAKLYDGSKPTTIFTRLDAKNSRNLEFVKIDFSTNILPQILQYTFNLGIQSIIVEGGRQLLQSFIDNNLWDEARVFYGNKDFQAGIKAPNINSAIKTEEKILDDSLIVYNNLN